MQETFKSAMARFATGVCVVTYEHPDTQMLDGVTVSAFCSVSIEPLKVLFCLGNLGVGCQTFGRVNRFAVNILSQSQKDLAYQFAEKEVSVDRALLTEIQGVPCLADTLATIICDKGTVYPEGDHDIVVGDVDKVVLGDTSRQPLLYFKSTLIQDYQHG